jgi:hypothetical protein
MRRLRLLGVLGATAAVALTGCGGGDDPVGGDAQEADASADAGVDDGAAEGSGEVSAVVTIGDEEFVGEETRSCISLGGAVEGIFYAADGDVEIEIEIPPEDWEEDDQSDWSPPSVVVTDERPDPRVAWQSGTAQFMPGSEVEDEDYAGVAVVDSFTVDGSSASGSATYIDDQALVQARADGTPIPEPVGGSFEISCG